MNFPCSQKNFRQLPVTFRAVKRHSVKFRQLSLRAVDLLSISVNYPFCQNTFRQLFQHSVRLGELPSTLVYFPCAQKSFRHLPLSCHVAGRPSVNLRTLFSQPGDFPSNSINFPCDQKTLHQLPSTICEAGRPSVNFRQHSIQPRELPLSSVNFPCGQKTFRQLSVHPQDIASTSVIFPCIRWTFHRLLSTFCASAGQLPSAFHASVGTFIKCLCVRWNFCQLPSIFRTSTGPSVNFRQLSVHLLYHWTFHQFYACFMGHSVNICEHLSIFCTSSGPSINFCVFHGTFHQYPSSIHASAGPTVNLHQLSLHLLDLL